MTGTCGLSTGLMLMKSDKPKWLCGWKSLRGIGGDRHRGHGGRTGLRGWLVAALVAGSGAGGRGRPDYLGARALVRRGASAPGWLGSRRKNTGRPVVSHTRRSNILFALQRPDGSQVV